MEIKINLENYQGYDNETIAETIRDIIKTEIDNFIRGLIRKTLKDEEKRIKAVVEKAAKKDWKRVADLLGVLEENK